MTLALCGLAWIAGWAAALGCACLARAGYPSFAAALCIVLPPLGLLSGYAAGSVT